MSFYGQRVDGSTHLIGVESEELPGWIWTQLGNRDTPPMAVFLKTQDDVPPCTNIAYIVERSLKLYLLLQFNGASNMVNEEDQEAAPASISMVLMVPRNINLTSFVPGPSTR